MKKEIRNAPQTFTAGEIVELKEDLALMPPGRYIFAGVDNNIAHFQIGAAIMGTNAEFLQYFRKADTVLRPFDEWLEFESYLRGYQRILNDLDNTPWVEVAGGFDMPALGAM